MTKTLAALAALLWQSTALSAPAPHECTQQELLGFAPSETEVEAHRMGKLPTVEYAKGESPGRHWGFKARLRIDERGRVACYRLEKQRRGDALPLNPERRDWVAKLAILTYVPFPNSESPQPAIVTEYVRESELAGVGVVPPSVPLAQASVSLERTACYGGCPAYTVTVRGTGEVRYDGGGHVDVEGEHRYTIPIADAARLIESLYEPALWSAKDEYEGGITDHPTQHLTIRLGKHTKKIRDYVGAMAGMPVAISELEREIDKVAGTERWIQLSAATVELLDAEGFDFAGPAGSALLWRAAMNRDTKDDRALMRLLQLGVRADADPPDSIEHERGASLLTAALSNRRVELAQALIAAGALKTAGVLDPVKVNAAFRAGIAGGRLAGVEQVWSASAPMTPELEYDDTGEDRDEPAKRVPVTLLLRAAYDDEHWEGLEIARWLAARGCDLKASGADGRTLLHIAADGDDVAFVRYLLEEGFDQNTPDGFGLTALWGTSSEDVAMLLLEAGADPSSLSNDGVRFRAYVEGNHWQRVVTWLDQHK